MQDLKQDDYFDGVLTNRPGEYLIVLSAKRLDGLTVRKALDAIWAQPWCENIAPARYPGLIRKKDDRKAFIVTLTADALEQGLDPAVEAAGAIKRRLRASADRKARKKK